MGFWTVVFIASACYLLCDTCKEMQQKAYKQGYQNAQSKYNALSQLELEKAYKRELLHNVLLSLGNEEAPDEAPDGAPEAPDGAPVGAPGAPGEDNNEAPYGAPEDNETTDKYK